ncbi:MAG: dihydrofolate reductase [Planctomycetota bacterium]
MIIALIVAASENNVIGRAGDLPWHLPDDLKRFKAATSGHVIIMGRKTFASVGKPLPNRTNIVITRNTTFTADDVLVCHSLDDALNAAREHTADDNDEVFIVGGEALYREALPRAQRMYLTRVHAIVEGDTHFPRLDEAWILVAHEHRARDDRHAIAHSFQTWERRP